jgi:hypothetical protein
VILLVFPQVRASHPGLAMSNQVFEKFLLPAPPAGFEPAHTAPETMCCSAVAPTVTCGNVPTVRF